MATLFRGPLIFRTWLRDERGVAINSQTWVQQNLANTLNPPPPHPLNSVVRGPLIFRTWRLSSTVAIESQGWVTPDNVLLGTFVPPLPKNQEDWPNPGTKDKRVSVNTTGEQQSDRLNNLLIGKDTLPQNQKDWPNSVWPKDRRVSNNTYMDERPDRLLNLLIGKDTLPKNQNDWPNPVWPKSRLIAQSSQSWLESDRLNNLLVGKDKFFWAGPPDFDWPNPTLPKSRLTAIKAQEDVWQWAINLYSIIVAAPFAQYDWPNPFRPVSRQAAVNAEQETGQLNNLLVGQDVLPFNETEWPNPTRPKDMFGAAVRADCLQQAWVLAVAVPEAQYEWPNPAPAKDRRAAILAEQQTDRLNNLLVGQDQLPFNETDWPIPLRMRVPNYDALVQNLLPLTTASIVSPFSQDDWPNPTLPRDRQIAVRAEQQTGRINLLTGKDQLPEDQYDWPNPTQPKSGWVARNSQAWIESDRLNNLLIGKDQLPNNETYWPNPTLRMEPLRSQMDLENFLVLNTTPTPPAVTDVPWAGFICNMGRMMTRRGG